MQEAAGMNEQMVESRSPSDKRKMSLRQQRADLWPRKKKKRDRQYKERGPWHCLCLHALCFPLQIQELEGGFQRSPVKTAKRLSL